MSIVKTNSDNYKDGEAEEDPLIRALNGYDDEE